MRQPRNCFTAQRAIGELVKELSAIVADKPCILLDWPAYANVGDHLIWLGTKAILKGHMGATIRYQSSCVDADLSGISLEDAAILCQGGGNFGDLYPQHQKFREKIALEYPDNPVVFMPQSIFYESLTNFQEAGDILSNCSNVTMFTRDAHSYFQGRELLPNAEVTLGIDPAFALQPYIARMLMHFGLQPTRPLYLIRRDRETASVFDHIPRNAVVADWVDEQFIEELLTDEECDSAIASLGLDFLVDSELDTISLRYLLRSVKLFASANRVVTDRLHGKILALLLGIPCDLYDNSYKKNFRFARLWTADDVLLRLCT